MRLFYALIAAAILAPGVFAGSKIIAPELADWGARPVVDGAIGPKEYRGCSRQPLMFAKEGIAADPMGYFEIGIYQGRYLHFVFETRTMTRMPKVANGRRDGNLWEHDGVELHLKIGTDHFQLIVDSDGNIFDAKNGNVQWDAPWQAKAAHIGTEFAVAYAGGDEIPERGFLVEVALDMQGIIDLGKPAQMQVVLNYAGEGPAGFWQPHQTLLIKDSPFGTLTWRGPMLRFDKVAVRDGGRRLIFEGSDSYAAGLNVTSATGRAATDRWVGKFSTNVKLAGGSDYQVEVRQESSFPNELRFPVSARLEVPVIAVNVPSRQAVFLEFDPAKVETAERSVLTLKFRRDEIVFKQLELDPAQGKLEIFVPWGEWGPGKLAIEIFDAAGVTKGTVNMTLNDQIPEWFNWRMPETPAVLAPWTPVEATKKQTKVWGREFTFGQTPFVDQIHSQGVPLLAAPVELRAMAGGRPVAWQLNDWQLVKSEPDCARYRSVSTAAGMKLTVELSVEFDGCTRIDFTIEPENGKVKVDQLSWVLPARRELAELYMRYATQSYSFNDTSTWCASGALPEKGLASEFVSFLWLGNEKTGIQWFAEDKAGWRPADPGRAIEVKNNSKRSELILHLADMPFSLDKPLSYSMGLMPSPVKPRRHNDIQGNRILVLSNYKQLGGTITEYGKIQIPIRYDDMKPDGSLEARFSPENGFEAQKELKLMFHGNSQGNRQILNYYPAERKLILTHQAGNHGTKTLAEIPVELKADNIYTLTWNYGRKSALYLDGKVLLEVEDVLPPPVFDYWAQDNIGGSGFLRLYQWRSSRGHRTAADSRPEAQWQPDAATRHLSDLAGDPTTVRMVMPVNENLSSPAYLEGDWQYRAGDRSLSSVKRPAKSALEYYASLGVKAAVFFEWAKSPCGHDGVADEQGLRSMAEQARAAGIALIPYTPWGYTSHDPLAAGDWRHELGLARPGGEPTVSWRESGRIFYKTHSGEVAVRRLLWDYDRILRLGAGGFYFDGSMYPEVFSSNIVKLPVKYDPFTGKEVPVTRIFARREFMKQVYKLAEHYLGENVIIDAHASVGNTLPTMSFATDSTNGESLGVFGNNWPEVLTVDTFAAEYHATQYGFNSDALIYHGSPVPVEYGVALAGIHGQTPRPILWGLYPARGEGIWGIVDRFDPANARWFSYRDPANPLKPSDKQILASMWVHPDGRALVMAANWGESTKVIRFKIDSQALGFTPKQANLLNRNEPLKIAGDSTFSLEMRPKWLHIIELK